jgi:hypothetical protein
MRKERLSVGELMGRLEDADGPGPLLFALTLPVLLPMPPGVSMLLALPLLMVAPQLVLGRRRLWMPKALSRRTVARKELSSCCTGCCRRCSGSSGSPTRAWPF